MNKEYKKKHSLIYDVVDGFKRGMLQFLDGLIKILGCVLVVGLILFFFFCLVNGLHVICMLIDGKKISDIMSWVSVGGLVFLFIGLCMCLGD